jgi:NADH-quinone oxidoreductase subunit C
VRQDEILKLVKEKFPEAAQEESTKALIIPKAMLLGVADFLRNQELAFDNLHCVTAVDRIEKIELVYIFQAIEKRHTLMIKIYLALDDLKVESLASVWKSADWFEREIYDLFGVYFLNHPDLRRILTPYNWDVHPLRKDFSRPDFIKKPR